MDLTPSQPVAPGDEPFGEQPAQPAEAATLAAGPAATADSQPRLHDEATASRSSKEIGGKKFRVGPRNDYVPFRTRSKRKRRLIVTGVVVLVLIGVGAYGVGSLIGSPSQSSTASSCPAKANAAGDVANSNVAGAANAQSVALTGALVGQLPTAPQIKLNVYNSTNRHGLAATAATALKQRGFSIGKVTNDPLKANLTTAAEVRGASANAAAMRVVAAEVAGSQLHPDSRTDDSVDLVLGAGFTALASPDQVSAALKQAQQVAQAPQTQAAPPKAAGSKCS